MDVRCEKCLTEYELDEARLKPTGVTVKCTNCGHMFKIRKRANTNVGAAPRASTAQPRPQTSSGPLSDPMAAAPDGSERVWMIRLENGETKTCRELATLQQWIVAGVVTRESLISRTGKTWKRLGDITELGSYFTVADEARGQRQQRTSDRNVGAGQKPVLPAAGTLLGVGVTAPRGPEDIVSNPALPTPAPDTAISPTSARTPPMGSGTASARTPTVRPADSARITSPEAIAATLVTTDEQPTPARAYAPVSRSPVAVGGGHILPDQPPPSPPRPMKPTPPPPPPGRGVGSVPPPGGDRATGAWVASAIKDISERHAVPQGPMGGRVNATGEDQAFGGQVRPMGKDTGGFGGEVYDPDATGPVTVPGSGGLGKWIALGALAVIALASIVIFYVMHKGKGNAAVATSDGGTTVVAIGSGSDAAPAPVPDAAGAAVTPGDPLEEARIALYADVRERESAAELALANRGEDPEALAMRARLSTGVAQSLDDEARLTPDKAKADAMRKQKTTTVLDAVKLASRAVAKAPTSPLANAAMADLLRLQGKPAKDIRKYLDAAGPAAATDREIALVAAMTDLRDKKPEARTELGKLDAAAGQPGSMEQTGDVRPRFQLALLLAADGKTEDARAAVESILAMQPDHAGARALQGKLASAVATTDPMPPEDGSNGAGAGSAHTGTGNTGTGNTGTGNTGSSDDNNFDRVLAKANAAAENSCAQAMPLYQRALELKPNSVEALTGVGYCHLDNKEFQAAYSKFRAALMISPHYERALWGVAEMYQQQGKTDKAIENYCKYLEVFPTNQAAQRQLEHLGGNCNKTDDNGGGDGGSSSGGTSSGSDTTTPPTPPPSDPPPAPAPTPTP